MPTLNYQIGAFVDDGGRKTGSIGWENTGTLQTLGYYNASTHYHCHIYARFDGVTIPPGVTIDSATLELYADGVSGTVNAKIYGVDEDDPAVIASAANFDDDPLTTASVDWDEAFSDGNWNTSPDIKTIVQELVDSYVITNEAIMFQLKNDGPTTDNYANIRQYSYAGNAHGAKLNITYSTDFVPKTILIT